MFVGRTDSEAEAQNTEPPDARSQLTGKTLMLGKIEGKVKMRLQRMKSLDGITDSMDMNLGKLRDSKGQRGLACCSPWGY